MVALAHRKVRTLLAVLLTHAGECVPMTVLYDSMWPCGLPRNPRNAVQINVHRLRRLLGDPDRITCFAGGYRLAVREGELDRHRFEDLVSRSHEAGDVVRAAELLRQALALWRGRPHGEFGDVEVLRIEAQAMTERWLGVQEELAVHELALGSHAEVAVRMRALTAEHPFRERAHELLMHALVQTGCPGEALRQYDLLRRRLAADLGADPSAGLRRLHRQLLVAG